MNVGSPCTRSQPSVYIREPHGRNPGSVFICKNAFPFAAGHIAHLYLSASLTSMWDNVNEIWPMGCEHNDVLHFQVWDIMGSMVVLHVLCSLWGRNVADFHWEVCTHCIQVNWHKSRDFCQNPECLEGSSINQSTFNWRDQSQKKSIGYKQI